MSFIGFLACLNVVVFLGKAQMLAKTFFGKVRSSSYAYSHKHARAWSNVRVSASGYQSIKWPERISFCYILLRFSSTWLRFLTRRLLSKPLKQIFWWEPFTTFSVKPLLGETYSFQTKNYFFLQGFSIAKLRWSFSSVHLRLHHCAHIIFVCFW